MAGAVMHINDMLKLETAIGVFNFRNRKHRDLRFPISILSQVDFFMAICARVFPLVLPLPGSETRWLTGGPLRSG